MGLAMLAPALADWIAGHRDWTTFAVSSACSIFLGGLLVLGSIGSPIRLSLRQGFMLTTLSWVIPTVGTSDSAGIPFRGWM
jgi:trk system potassium uptake protein TrkH